MIVIIGSTVHLTLVLETAAGVPVDADALPTAEVILNGVAASLLSPTVTKRVGKTGEYDLAFDATIASGFAVDDYFTVNAYGAIAAAAFTKKIVTARISLAIADEVIDEILSGATHNVPGSLGRRIRELSSSVATSGTAQGPGLNGNQIQLAATASALDGAYDPGVILIAEGTGAGQSRRIIEYDGTSKIAALNRTWRIAPDATSVYIIFADPGGLHVNEGLLTGAGVSTAKLNALASTVDDAYVGQVIFLVSGTGEDQARIVTDYVGATQTATVNRPWDTLPDTTSGYLMLPFLAFDPLFASFEDNGAGTTWTWTEGFRLMFARLLGERTGGGVAGDKEFTVPGGVLVRVKIPTNVVGNTTGLVVLDASDA